MFGAEAKCAIKFGCPCARSLVRTSINQVKADTREMALCGVKRRQSFVDIMCATEKMERRIIESLKPERTAIDARLSQIGKACCLD